MHKGYIQKFYCQVPQFLRYKVLYNLTIFIINYSQYCEYVYIHLVIINIHDNRCDNNENRNQFNDHSRGFKK